MVAQENAEIVMDGESENCGRASKNELKKRADQYFEGKGTKIFWAFDKTK